MGVPHARHAANPARLLAIMADAKADAQRPASHAQSHVLGTVSTRGSVTCPVAHLAAGCPVMRDAPRSCHVDTSARACVGKPAHQGHFASSVVIQRSQRMMQC